MRSPIVSAESAYHFYIKQVHYNDEEYNEQQDRKVIRASSAGRCHKLHAYHLSDVEAKAHDYQTLKIFRIGSVFHDEVQKGMMWLIKEQNKDKEEYEIIQEKKVSLEIFKILVEGHYDNILINHKTKRISVYDWKTMNPRSFSYFKKSPQSKDGYIIQGATYCIALEKEYPDYDIDFTIVGFNKDTGEFKEACWHIDEIKPKALQYWKGLSGSIEKFSIGEFDRDPEAPKEFAIEQMIAGVTPNVPVNNKWECNYCSYNHVCNSKFITRR